MVGGTSSASPTNNGSERKCGTRRARPSGWKPAKSSTKCAIRTNCSARNTKWPSQFFAIFVFLCGHSFPTPVSYPCPSVTSVVKTRAQREEEQEQTEETGREKFSVTCCLLFNLFAANEPHRTKWDGRERTQRGGAAIKVAPVANRLYRGLPTRRAAPSTVQPATAHDPPTGSRRYSRLGSQCVSS